MWDANYLLNFFENKNFVAGRYDKALNQFERLAKRYPNHFGCKYMIKQIYEKLGRREDLNRIKRELREIMLESPEITNALINKYDLDLD
tara:strand:- start:5901 stop:6167 length:267 start_codon:yes stop_codon:yes gene_type:complete